MITSQEHLDKVTEIVKSLDGHLLEADQKNRRRLSRVALRMQITVTLLTGIAPSAVDVLTRNISLSGLGFVCRRMFRPEERIAVLLRIPKVPPKLLLARVTFGRYIGGGLYEMGSEFLECISDARAAAPAGGTARIPNHWLVGASHAKAAHVTAPTAAPAAAAPAPAA